jgi:hypothetical protein
LLERAVRSAFAAIAPDDEVIVVDNGSTDGTEEALRPYGYRLRYIRTERSGAGAARNRGIREARTPLVAFLDSDDEYLPWRIQLTRLVLEARPDLLFCYSDFRSEHPNKVFHRAMCNWNPRAPHNLGPAQPYSSIAALPDGWPDFACHIGHIYAAQIDAPIVCTITCTARIEAGPCFAEDLPTYEDWWCFTQYAHQGPGAYLDCETAIQHCHVAPRLTDADTLTCAETRLRMLEGIWGADRGFLAEHGGLYHRHMAEQRLRKVKGLIKRGRVHEARAELMRLETIPALYQGLCRLPGPLVAMLFGIRAKLQGLAERGRS